MKYTKITISGKVCTGKTTLYKNLEKILSWKAFSTGHFFREYAEKHHLVLEKAQEQNDQLTKKIDYMARDFIKENEHVIIEGWLAGIMAKNIPKTLKVLLICKDNERVKRFAKREKVNLEHAKQMVQEREASWLKKIEQIYGNLNINDYNHYDLVLDTTVLDKNVVIGKVLDALGFDPKAKNGK